MGNYLFKPGCLKALLEQAIGRGGTDFGRHILPALPDSGYRAFAYDFAGNEVPGVLEHEERAYWRDVGTLQALAEARRDIAGPRPRFNLRNPAWPIRRDLVIPPMPGSERSDAVFLTWINGRVGEARTMRKAHSGELR